MLNTTWPWTIAIYISGIVSIIAGYYSWVYSQICVICIRYGVDAYKNGLHVVSSTSFKLSDGTQSDIDSSLCLIFLVVFLAISFIPVIVTYKLGIKYGYKSAFDERED